MNINVPKQSIDALKIIVNKIQDKNLRWVLGGSMALAIQGVDVKVNDINIFTDTDSADKISEILKEYAMEPMHFQSNSQFRAYYGLFEIKGVQVELIANLEYMYDNIWIRKENQETLMFINFANMTLPLLDLKEEYEAYKRMGRTEKANKILEALKKKA